MSYQEKNSINRRRFITGVGAASLISGAAGARIASWRNQNSSHRVTVAPDPVYTEAVFDCPNEPIVTNPAELTQAQDTIARLTAENNQLQTDYAALQQELETLKASLSGQTDQVAELETQLAGVRKERSAALGLVALYEQLEDINLKETFAAGFTTVGEAWGDFIDDLPSASDELEEVKALVSEFDRQIPIFQTARNWLVVRLELLNRDNNLLQEVLETISQPAGTILEMLSNWFDQVRSWVPARFLQSANNVIDSLMSIMSGIPVTVDGTQSNVIDALDGWFSDEVDQQDSTVRSPVIRNRLFNPLIEKTIPQTVILLQKTRLAKQKYEANLVTQVDQTMQKREAIETSILEYRERNGLTRPQV